MGRSREKKMLRVETYDIMAFSLACAGQWRGGGGWGTGNLKDTAIQTLTHRRFKIPSLKIDDEQHMTHVLSRKGSYLFFRAY